MKSIEKSSKPEKRVTRLALFKHQSGSEIDNFHVNDTFINKRMYISKEVGKKRVVGNQMKPEIKEDSAVIIGFTKKIESDDSTPWYVGYSNGKPITRKLNIMTDYELSRRILVYILRKSRLVF